MSAQRHAGRVVVVTGGGSGIGLATAGRFAVEGASVYIVGRDESKLERARQQLLDERCVKVTPLTGDVADPASMAAAAAAVTAGDQGIDVLVNNAAGRPLNLHGRRRLHRQPPAPLVGRRGWHCGHDGRLRALPAPRRQCPQHGVCLRNHRRGRGSVLQRREGRRRRPDPRVRRRTRTARHQGQLREPGMGRRAEVGSLLRCADLQHLRGAFTRVPLRAAVTADEIAAVYAFLAHEDAAAISGQDIVVDRGMSADLYVTPTVPGLA